MDWYIIACVQPNVHIKQCFSFTVQSDELVHPDLTIMLDVVQIIWTPRSLQGTYVVTEKQKFQVVPLYSYIPQYNRSGET